MRISDLAGRRVAIWGYGREGRAALAALRTRLPQTQLTVFCSEAEAADLRSCNVADVATTAITSAPDAAALSAFDVVIKSPGISAYRPELLEAQHNGARFTSGTALWFAENADARVIAVTGTKGKSTVSALIAHLLRALRLRTALAGNIGLPLLDLLDAPAPPKFWVIELSSFQTRAATHVEVGVINNLDEEHLDWHGTREHYASDKLALADAARTLIVNANQPELIARTRAHPHRLTFGNADAWHVRDGALFCAGERMLDLAALPLAGSHNALNVCAALTAVEAVGEDASAALTDLHTFRPLPHRLQMLGKDGGVMWIDDSIATTPQATLEALGCVEAVLTTVLVGGHDRGLDWQPFADAVRRAPPHAIVTMGANGARIADVLRKAGGGYRLETAAALDDAVAIARRVTPANGIILLSPGAPSFDQFCDYAERGRAFAALGGFDASVSDAIDGLGIA